MNDPRDFRPSPAPGDAAGPARHPPATLRLFPPSLALARRCFVTPPKQKHAEPEAYF